MPLGLVSRQYQATRTGILKDKTMYISNDDAQNYPFCRLELLVENIYT